MIGEERGADDPVRIHQPSALVTVLEELLSHDAALDLEVGEDRRADDLPEDADRFEDRLGRGGEDERAVVDAGRGVEARAEVLDPGRERVRGRKRRGPAVEHVLEEVREARRRRLLEARADVEHAGDGGAVEVGAGRERHRDPAPERARLEGVLRLGDREAHGLALHSSSSGGGGALVPPAFAEDLGFGKKSSFGLISAVWAARSRFM